MYKELLQYLSKKPDLYESSTSKFWADEHISKGMLEAHLDPECDAATRKMDFVLKSVDFIVNYAQQMTSPTLLDLGCGPGIYAELFTEKGIKVTGMDLSPRSIQYARVNAGRKNLKITYFIQNYLELDFVNQFDIITLIYCDFGVLTPADRQRLLNKILRALKPGGVFIVDAWTPHYYANKEELNTWNYAESGFWSAEPYSCLNSFYRYDNCNTFVDQYVIVKNERVECYHIWNHAFTIEEFEEDLTKAGFAHIDFYGDIAGTTFSDYGPTICAVARK